MYDLVTGLTISWSCWTLSCLFIAVLELPKPTKCVSGDAATEVEKHLSLGTTMLASGQLGDALTHYHAAIEGDPSNYLSYFRRATVYLAMGKARSALTDLDRVLELKPDFTAARLQRGNVYLKQGALDDAYIDYERVLARQPDADEAHANLELIDLLRGEFQMIDGFMEEQPTARDCREIMDALSRAIDACPWDATLLEQRSECHILLGDHHRAVADLRPTTRLRTDNRAAHLKISQLLYAMGLAEDSLTEVRECLKLDPDDAQCFEHYRLVKKLAKQIAAADSAAGEQRWDACVAAATRMLATETRVPAFVARAKSLQCRCLASAATDVAAAVAACTEVLTGDPNNVDALCSRADAHLLEDRYDDAIRDYQAAVNVDEESRRARDGLTRAQKLEKQSKKRDYYKILGVKRTARKREIEKAYRRLAMEWHPDKFSDEEEKKRAGAKFMDIAAAKEVLTDPEKRQKFDNGEDPLDPEDQQHGHPWGYQQGFNPFGHNTFKFHFN
ncbi:PREDICTED: dnaJ homolog subfamily C member 3-like [Priapulus caudatus]|uniref:DnaJ homolog subfamily C member 3-like n=1 Tax=Priapulus caudatus TaxID=37621 RepID=A0ABM1EN51_PRICU|nr:PREDICTED: dnaJ homolog subfamily C member 3-like [Priapulus caudatus]